MIGYVMVGTNHLDKAIIFYDDVLKELNLKRVETDPEYAAYAPMDKLNEIEFYVTKPFNKEKATNGNGTQVSFVTTSRQMVNKFHETGLNSGGKSEGAPGERPQGSKVYYSYVRDLDGNKICVFTNI